MRIRIILASLLLATLAFSCKKETAPTEPKTYDFTFRVKISDKINEPTVISGFYGHLMEYKGDFMPKVGEGDNIPEANKPKPADNQILLYPVEDKEAIEKVAFQDKGITFYNLKELHKLGVKPKYTIIPNEKGFYQMDLGDQEYCILIEISKSKAYFNGGVQTLKGTVSTLEEKELRIDYAATF